MSVFDSLSQIQKNLILKHLELVEYYNSSINLTRIHKDNSFLLHIEDSLYALPYIKSAPQGIYADLGTGGGFPGIPLAIASDRITHLIDYRVRKVTVLNSIISELNLQNKIKAIPKRAELIAVKNPNKYTVITARAVSRLNVLLELASPLLKKEALLICYKGELDNSELKEALDICKTVGMSHLKTHSYTLEEEYKRALIVFKKTHRPSINLPRREGQAQKSPLI